MVTSPSSVSISPRRRSGQQGDRRGEFDARWDPAAGEIGCQHGGLSGRSPAAQASLGCWRATAKTSRCSRACAVALADAAPATAPVAVAATAWVPRLDGEAGGAGGGVERTTVGPAGEPWPADRHRRGAGHGRRRRGRWGDRRRGRGNCRSYVGGVGGQGPAGAGGRVERRARMVPRPPVVPGSRPGCGVCDWRRLVGRCIDGNIAGAAGRSRRDALRVGRVRWRYRARSCRNRCSRLHSLVEAVHQVGWGHRLNRTRRSRRSAGRGWGAARRQAGTRRVHHRCSRNGGAAADRRRRSWRCCRGRGGSGAGPARQARSGSGQRERSHPRI